MGIQEIAESLLYERESATLDFKRDQYKFDHATDAEKAALLKDILAFANAWRRTDAYIFIGIDEGGDGTPVVVGIAKHIDDAKLQQFVNAKTNRTLDFSYRPLTVQSKQVALIQIPVQQRPVYLTRDFGGLRKHEIYVRRGSSTTVADPEEIARMGRETERMLRAAPELAGFLVVGEHDDIIEKAINLETVDVQMPSADEIGDYGMRGMGGPLDHFFTDPIANRDYFREYAAFLKERAFFQGARLCVKNTGQLVARDVKMILRIDGSPEDIFICTEGDLPDQPAANTRFDYAARLPTDFGATDVACRRLRADWCVTADLGKVQASDYGMTSDKLFIGMRSSGTLTITCQIFSDDLPAPVGEVLTVSVNVTTRKMSPTELYKVAKAR